MRVREVAARTALTSTTLPGLDYSLNPYRGCTIACAYCYSPSVLGESRPWGRFVDVKRNVPNVLARELKRASRGVVGVGTVTDGYQPVEQRYRVTHYCLEQLVRYDFPVSVQTKSSLVLRDVPTLSRLETCDVGVTITTVDDRMHRLLEPFASPPDRRIETLRALADAGLDTWAFLGPILPADTARGLEELVRRLADADVGKVVVDRLRLKDGIWDRMAPVLRAAGLEAAFRDALDGPNDYFASVRREIGRLCEAFGVPWEPAFPSSRWTSP